MKKTSKNKIEEFIRVDHAGERGAIKIYEGQLLALNTFVKDENLKKTIENSTTGKEIRKYNYVYDNMNNWILRETFKGDKLIFVDTRQIVYYN